MRTPLAPLVVASLGLAACTTVLATSEPLVEGGVGVPYSLPKTVVSGVLEVAAESDENGDFDGYRVTLELAPEIVPDPTLRYLLRHNTSAGSDEDLRVAVDAAGLLTSVNAKATDRTLDIVQELGKSVVSVAKLASLSGMGFSAGQNEGDAVARFLQDRLQELVGRHPFSAELPAETATPVVLPLTENWHLALEVFRLDATRGGDAADAPPASGPAPTGAAGVYVRAPEPVFVRVRLVPGTGVEVAAASLAPADVAFDAGELRAVARQHGVSVREVDGQLQLGFAGDLAAAGGLWQVTNFSPIVVVPLRKSMLADTTHDLVFQKGILASAHGQLDSSALAVAKLPGVLATELVKLPAELIQLKIDLTTQQLSLAEKEAQAQEKAQEAAAGAVQAQLELELAFIEAETEAKLAKLAYEEALGADPPDAVALTKAAGTYRAAAEKANAMALLAGKPAPFDPASLP